MLPNLKMKNYALFSHAHTLHIARDLNYNLHIVQIVKCEIVQLYNNIIIRNIKIYEIVHVYVEGQNCAYKKMAKIFLYIFVA